MQIPPSQPGKLMDIDDVRLEVPDALEKISPRSPVPCMSGNLEQVIGTVKFYTRCFDRGASRKENHTMTLRKLFQQFVNIHLNSTLSFRIMVKGDMDDGQRVSSISPDCTLLRTPTSRQSRVKGITSMRP